MSIKVVPPPCTALVLQRLCARVVELELSTMPGAAPAVAHRGGCTASSVLVAGSGSGCCPLGAGASCAIGGRAATMSTVRSLAPCRSPPPIRAIINECEHTQSSIFATNDSMPQTRSFSYQVFKVGELGNCNLSG